MYNRKIQKIDELINNEELFNNYLETLEKNENIKIPSNLTNNILDKIQPKKETKVIKLKKMEILKVACFALFAVIMWNVIVTFDTNDINFEEKISKEVKKQDKIENIQTNLDKVTNKITTFFITPTIGDERGVK